MKQESEDGSLFFHAKGNYQHTRRLKNKEEKRENRSRIIFSSSHVKDAHSGFEGKLRRIRVKNAEDLWNV